MYVLFSNEDKYYVISRNNLNFDEYERSCSLVLEGTKKEVMNYIDDNRLENIEMI